MGKASRLIVTSRRRLSLNQTWRLHGVLMRVDRDCRNTLCCQENLECIKFIEKNGRTGTRLPRRLGEIASIGLAQRQLTLGACLLALLPVYLRGDAGFDDKRARSSLRPGHFAQIISQESEDIAGSKIVDGCSGRVRKEPEADVAAHGVETRGPGDKGMRLGYVAETNGHVLRRCNMASLCCRNVAYIKKP